MPFIVLGAGLVLSLLTTLALGFPVRNLARARGWVDKPDGGRKLHQYATPTIGGIAIVGGFVVGLTFLTAFREQLPFDVPAPPFGLWAGAAIIVAAGFYDDVRGLTFRQKFAVQVLAAYFLLHAGYQIDLGALPFVHDSYHEALYSIPLSLLWIVGITNAINLVDGLDGLATGIVYIGLACLTLVFSIHGDSGLIVLSLPLFGALAGFLIHNFNRASIFMGDSGSLFLGFMLAAASLHGTAHVHPVLSKAIPIVILGLPVLDTLLCIARRWLNGRSMFAPDRDHIHHRMLRHASARQVVVRLYFVALSFGMAATLMTILSTQIALVILAITVLLTGVGVYSLGYLDSLPQLLKQALGFEEAAIEDRTARVDGHASVGFSMSPKTAEFTDTAQMARVPDGSEPERIEFIEVEPSYPPFSGVHRPLPPSPTTPQGGGGDGNGRLDDVRAYPARD